MGLLARALKPSGLTHGRPPGSFLLSPGDVSPMMPDLIRNIVRTLYGASFEHIEQLSLLGQLQIPNRNHVTNFGTYSNLNLS
jgi:hypothetical protein